MISSLTTALEEINKQLRREIDILKTDVTQLRTNNDAMKGENMQLTTLLDKMAVNNDNQIQQINSQSTENATMKEENKQLKTENDMIKAKNVQLKIENDDLKVCLVDTSSVSQRKQQLKVTIIQWLGITLALHIYYPNHPHINHTMPNHCL